MSDSTNLFRSYAEVRELWDGVSCQSNQCTINQKTNFHPFRLLVYTNIFIQDYTIASCRHWAGAHCRMTIEAI